MADMTLTQASRRRVRRLERENYDVARRPERLPLMGSEKVRLGGMALGNGLLVHGPTHWAAAVRSQDGQLRLASGRKPVARGRVAQLPGVRGVARLAEAFAVVPLVKLNLPEARLPFENVKVVGSMAGSGALSSVLRRLRPGAVNELAIAVLGMAPALMALRGSQLAAYHGVEHKAIGAYEVGGDARQATKEHERCGSNLVLPMLLSSAIGNHIVERVLGLQRPWAKGAVALSSAALSVELFAWSERNRGRRLARALKLPGHQMQRLFVTREPTERQMEVGEAAMAEILRLEGAEAR